MEFSGIVQGCSSIKEVNNIDLLGADIKCFQNSSMNDTSGMRASEDSMGETQPSKSKSSCIHVYGMRAAFLHL